MTPWHYGARYGAEKRPRWANHWLDHQCHDLALPLELGTRAYLTLTPGTTPSTSEEATPCPPNPAAADPQP